MYFVTEIIYFFHLSHFITFIIFNMSSPQALRSAVSRKEDLWANGILLPKVFCEASEKD